MDIRHDGAVRPISGYSGMADITTEQGHASEESVVRSLSAALRRLSRMSSRATSRSGKSKNSERSKSVKSTKSAKSKRTSGSTVNHRWGGNRWDVVGERDREDKALLVDGEQERVEGDVRKKEEMMDLLTLVGRAAVLERMLRAGKRVSRVCDVAEVS